MKVADNTKSIGGKEVMRSPIIRLENLEKIYRTKNNSVKALENINLEINEGEIFGIIGLSGAGKSTLVRCINLLEKPTAGAVIFEGNDLTMLSSRELLNARKSIGMIFQQFNLLMQRTSLENICYPLEISGVKKADARKRAYELLGMVDLVDKADAYPSQLSGGQKQRIAIARALANNPKVLLCDEATSALDPTTTRSILSLLKDINKKLGITVIVITHEMAVIEEICDRVAIIDQSNIAEVGNVLEIFTKPKSEIAKRLVFSKASKKAEIVHGNKYRIIFDGHSSFEPIISNLVLECKTAVNILFAETKNIEGNAVGQMIIQVPDEKVITNRVLNYLKEHNVTFEEVEEDV